MTRSGRRTTRLAVTVLAAALLLAGCSGSRSASTPSVGVTPAAAPATDRYAAAVDAAARRGLHVWLETDLVKRWLTGPQAFREGVARVATLAKRPGVVGVKVADELGYHDGTTSPDQVLRFLRDTRAALRAAAPRQRVLIDVVVPELGCVAWAVPGTGPQGCAAAARRDTPAATLAALDRYVASGTVDVLDVSTGLRAPSTYAAWGTDRDSAQRAAWREIGRRAWALRLEVRGRKALAHPGAYTGGASQAARDVTTYVDIPRGAGASAVDVWTWRQPYQGTIYRLPDPGPRRNALWDVLVARHAGGVRLSTHFTPSSLERSLDADLAMVAGAFTDLFVAAGTG